MKVLMGFTLMLFMAVYVFLSCKKDDAPASRPLGGLPAGNKPPLANAGADTSLTLASCGEVISMPLDGRASTDPENQSMSYRWRQISGPQGAFIRNALVVNTRVDNLTAGDYAFELSIIDIGGLMAKDTTWIRISGSPTGYDFDLAVNGTFKYMDNSQDSYYCYYYGICNYFDRTLIQGKGEFATLGSFDVYFSETTDSAATKYATNSTISIYRSNMNSSGLLGVSTVNLKKLYQQGGGAFSGLIKITEGSAKRCVDTVFTNLAPLAISGTLDTAAHKATFRITGKTYF